MSQVVEYFEIDVPRCSLTFGVAPCQASLVSSPPTGTAKCFNSFATCQDTANIDLGTETLRFAKPASYLPRDIDCLPWISSIEFSPSNVSLGENLGQRASLKVTLSDHRHSDAGPGLDKYHAERGYDPYQRGSFWPRFRARYPSLQGVVCRWRIGVAGAALEDYETRHFFIESFDGPKSDGSFSITAKDVVKFLDPDRAQAPLLSGGSLSVGISAGDLSATLSPAGIGNSEYPVAGASSPPDDDFYVCIGGSEIVKVSARSNDTLTIVTRGALGTTAKSHSAGDRVQVVLYMPAMDPADIAYDVLTGYTDLPLDYIPLDEWQTETATYLGAVYTFVYCEPTPVSTILNRLIEQAGLAMWDDPLAQKLRMKVIRAVPITAQEVSEDNVLNKTFEPVDQPEKRCSRCWVYYAQNDPTKRFDDLDNYRSVARVEDPDDTEAIYGQPAIRKIFATGIAAGGSALASRIANLVVGRFANPPRRLKFSKFRGDLVPELGEGIQVDWSTLQDASGARELMPAQVVKFKPSAAVQQIEAEQMQASGLSDLDPTNHTIIVDFNTYNSNARTQHDALYGTPESGDTVNFIVQPGVFLGSTATGTRALEIGTFPAGVTVNVIVLGRIQGRGGNGGRDGQGGIAGGVALYTRQAINLAVDGDLWGGGGGGGGGSGGSGGGGGAGFDPGSGGGGVAVGSNGTTEAGGAPGVIPGEPDPAVAGGGPGLAGANSQFNGGAAGSAIDGVSFVTLGTWDGSTFTPGATGFEDIRGPQVN